MTGDDRRVLCVAHHFPLPPDDGSAVREMGLLGLLVRLGEVRLVTRPRQATTEEEIAELARLGVDVRLAPPARRRAWSGIGLWVRSVLHRTPPWVLLCRDPRMTAAIEEHLDWCTHLFALEEFAADHLLGVRVPPGRKVLLYKDLVYANPRYAAERQGSRVRGALRRWVTVQHERRLLALADTVVVNTEIEAEACERHLGRRPEAIVPNAIDLGPAWSAEGAAPGRVLWLGTLDNDWNRGGLLRLVAALRRAGLDVTLAVAGRGADDEVRAAVDGIGEVLGFVADTDALLGGCGAAVVPVWGGGGGRVKALVLLGSGIPVVATPAALDGTGAVDGVHCRVGDTPEELVALLAEVLADPEGSAAMGRRGRELVTEHHGWESRLPLLREALER